MENKKDQSNLPDCCKPKKEYKGDNPLMGLVYGLIPHTGCILFIIGAVLGATILMQFFKPVLMNRYIFHYLILISVGFATLSSLIYLRKNGFLSKEGIKKKKGYLGIMYGSTIGINLVLFFFIFPLLANIGSVSAAEAGDASLLEISVDIPCPGHAPLISNELKTIEGVKGSEFSFPNDFKVYYDAGQTSKEEILSLEVFEEYPAEVLSEELGADYLEVDQNAVSSSGSCCGGSSPGGCGCGGATCGA